ncbi:Gfo/Idh/MocA family protein [Allonocardiopsis opalescens]|uniref:Putative dehydrogenase n=1 Tax=Allonocardiopsis opalescens TaxID=1144618 RepID=A0A2T0QAW2_9ACTN|nr:Gfo/Idh/MocA family oxidoreductase [Allonocardiopsis opalescens]PRY00955.1 putative dehydrogenase [Allonocardiopsis opalescens]
MTEPVRIAVLGAGGRGAEAYGSWVLRHPGRARVVAVADPLAHRREPFADRAGVAPDARFGDWRPLLAAAARLDLDAVVVALPDREHVEPALAAAALRLPVLLEKPVATSPGELDRISAEGRRLGARVAVGHVLRFTPFWRSLRALVGAGAIGRQATIRLEENIGFWHFAHSYVRGNWRRADTSSPMVLAKTCHDLDLIRWFAGAPPITVASSGSLVHFRPENAPPGAPARCLDGCPAAADCPFYAPRYYADALADVHGWPVALVGPDTSPEGRLEGLRTGPYGRCVYACDNDVADHQQTVLEFADGLTATLTTSAFTGANTRTVQITGTRGEVSGRMETGEITLELFSPGAPPPRIPPWARLVGEDTAGPLGHRVLRLRAAPEHDGGEDHRGHSGGDDALMENFVAAVAAGTLGEAEENSLEAALDSHRMAFAAETARLDRRVVHWKELAV